jgi:antitoxin component of MazEF toxin-antitoxin module
MTTLRFTPVGDGLGLVFPADVLEHLQAADGVEVKLIETPDGAILQRVGQDVAAQLEIAKRVMSEDKEVLRKLAE